MFISLLDKDEDGLTETDEFPPYSDLADILLPHLDGRFTPSEIYKTYLAFLLREKIGDSHEIGGYGIDRIAELLSDDDIRTLDPNGIVKASITGFPHYLVQRGLASIVGEAPYSYETVYRKLR